MRLPRWARRLNRRTTTTFPPTAALEAIPVEQVAPPGLLPLPLTAAAAGIELDAAAWKEWRFGDRAWQAEAWRLYDITGPLRFISNWVGKSLSRCRLHVVELDSAGNPAGEVDDPELAALASVPFGAGDQRAEALKLAGIDLFVGGECYVVGAAGAGKQGTDAWWVVTGRQISRRGDQITIKRTPRLGGGIHTFRPGVDIIERVWTPHPNDAMEPDSPVRSAIPDLRELEVLRKRLFAELDSRLAGAGLLCIPDGIDLPRGADDPAGSAGFVALLQRTMAASLRNRDTAEAVVPIVVGGAAEAIKEIRHLTFWSDLSDQLLPWSTAAVDALGIDLDIPPEVLKGLGSSNHWSAWAISDEAVKVHIAPVADTIAAAVTDAYLAPALVGLGVDPARYAYALDTSALTVRPNRAADATTAHDRMLLSDDATRHAGAWTEADKPSDAERLRRLTQQLFLTNPDAVLASAELREIIGLPGELATPPVNDDTGDAPPPEPVADEQAPPQQPVPSQTRPEPRPVPADAALLPIARYAARRALSVAGGRLVPHRQRPAGMPRHQLHVHATPLTRAGMDVDRLLAGAWDDLGDALDGIAVDPVDLAARLDALVRGCLTSGTALTEPMVDAAVTATRPGRLPCPAR
jgi:hypothetical protein